MVEQRVDDGGTRQDAVQARWTARVGWRETVLLVLGLLILRIIYLVWLSPWELVADEAHYWEWARRPSLSYYSKGPGIAWMIAASTALFGDSEWAIRLPAAISSAIAMLVLARLTIEITRDERAGFMAAAALALIPIYQLEAILMTIDPPFMAAWVICAWIAWRAFSAHALGERPWLLWAALGLAIGVGFLIKYVIVLLAPGLLLYAILRRREVPWNGRLTAGIALALVAFAIAITPWIAWNSQHGWPAIRHELGHIGAPGGDVPPQWEQPHGIVSLLELLAAQIGVIGPPAFVLIVAATVRAIRTRRESDRWPAHLFLLSVGLPTIGFFLLASLKTGVEANWPVSGYLTLLVLVAEYSRGAWTRGWRWMLALGLVTGSIVAFPTAWARLPVAGDAVPTYRVVGARERATEVDALRAELRARTGLEPIVIAGAYGDASQLAYYLEGRPTVYDAGGYVGRRGSQYDYWADTDLSDPGLRGRPAVLFGQPAEKWRAAFEFGSMTTVGERPAVLVARGYGGPLPPGSG